MTWLIVFVAVALISAPVMWMMPSSAQKRQVILRERARELGLMVSIVDLPQTHRAKVRKEDRQQGVSYTLRIARQKKAQRARWFVWREEPADEPVARDTPPPNILEYLQSLREQMSPDMVGVESSEIGYSVFWRERGDSATVDAIAALLNRVRELAGGELIGS
ncbi:MAG: hypothetical protein ACI89D_001110 [Bermanella sp.]